MPAITGNKVPGDIPYPDYSRVKTFTVASGKTVKKGWLHAVSGGRLTDAESQALDFEDTGTGRIANHTNLVQAMNDGTAGDKVQCLMPGSRILLRVRRWGVGVLDNNLPGAGERIVYSTVASASNANDDDAIAVAHQGLPAKALLGTAELANPATDAGKLRDLNRRIAGLQGLVGRIFENYTKDANGNEKLVLEDGEIAVVEFEI